MTPEEHIAESVDSALTAERLFSENKPLQGAEIIWCSVKHAINAIGVQRGWGYGSYRQKKNIVKWLEDEGHGDLLNPLGTARRLHVHSDSGFLSTRQISEHREEVALLLERLLAIASLA